MPVHITRKYDFGFSYAFSTEMARLYLQITRIATNRDFVFKEGEAVLPWKELEYVA